MTQTDVLPGRAEHEAPAPAPPHERGKRWGATVARWIEALIPRGVGVVFLWAGATKAWDGSKLHRVFAFDGVPQPLIVPLTHAVWVAEIAIGLALLIGIARRRAVVAAILVLFL